MNSNLGLSRHERKMLESAIIRHTEALEIIALDDGMPVTITKHIPKRPWIVDEILAEKLNRKILNTTKLAYCIYDPMRLCCDCMDCAYDPNAEFPK